MYSLTRAEQETHIQWDTETRSAVIDTADPVTIRRLDKLVVDYPEKYRCVNVDAQYNAKRYEVPSEYIKFAKPS
ncbi:MAG: immunoglobulin, partial [Clostridia bacterium]|nr:immunoglobulin [Clostridia bacterium]